MEKPPSPPKPPENRLTCSACGYTATEREFYEKHKCYNKYLLYFTLISIPVSCIIAVIIELLGRF